MGLTCENVDWAATAAMVQAVGSVLAILVSGCLAIWVPLHMRHLEERARVRRDIKSIEIAAHVLADSWESLSRFIKKKTFHANSPPLIRVGINDARSMLDGVVKAHLSSSVREAVYIVYTSAAGLDRTLDILIASTDFEGAAGRLDCAPRIKSLRLTMKAMEGLVPIHVEGSWTCPEIEVPNA